MSYFQIEHAYDSKVVGCYPQSTKMGCDYNHSRPDSIDNVNVNEVPSFIPFTGCFVLQKQAKLTDFISTAILPTGFIVSEKTKNVMAQFKLGKHAFFPTKISYRDKVYDNYFWFIFEPVDLSEFVDFDKTKFYLTDFNDNKIRQMQINSAIELKNTHLLVAEETNGANYICSDLFHLKNNLLKDFDLLHLPISPYDNLISERLRQQLIDAGITGLRLKEKDWFRFQT